MSRAVIDLDDGLVAEVAKALGTRTQKETGERRAPRGAGEPAPSAGAHEAASQAEQVMSGFSAVKRPSGFDSQIQAWTE
jgi:Arc/MetJ family transcription regulator